MRAAIATIGAATVVACAVSREAPVGEHPARTTPAAVHGVEGERLAGLMLGLDRLTGTRLPQALDVQAAWDARANEVAEVARVIAGSASAIPDAAPPLAEPEREEFAALAEALRVRALALAADAERRDEERLRARVADLEDACESCHQRFRLPR